MGHGLPPPKGPMNSDPFMWMRSLSAFAKHALKKDPGLWMIVGPTAFGLVYATGMVFKKMAQDPNVILPFPWKNSLRYEDNFDKNTVNTTLPWNTNDYMKQCFKDRYKNHKRPEDIE